MHQLLFTKYHLLLLQMTIAHSHNDDDASPRRQFLRQDFCCGLKQKVISKGEKYFLNQHICHLQKVRSINLTSSNLHSKMKVFFV